MEIDPQTAVNNGNISASTLTNNDHEGISSSVANNVGLPAKNTNSNKIVFIIAIVILIAICLCSVIMGGLFVIGSQINKEIPVDFDSINNMPEDTLDYQSGDDSKEKNPDQVNGGDDINDIPAPDGFEWYLCKNMNTYFLRPDNWFVLEESTSNSQGCFISKEEIVNGGNFKTGLTVNFISDIEQISGVSADDYAFKFIDELRKKYQSSDYFEKKLVKQNMYSAILNLEDGEFPITAYYNAIAQKERRGLYIVIFESPTQNWNSEWENTGETIVGNMGFVE